MTTLLRVLGRILPLPLYGLLLVGISLTLRNLAAGRPVPIVEGPLGVSLTAPLPHFAAWTNPGGPDFLGFEGPLIIAPLLILMALGVWFGGFHRALLGRIALVSMGVGAGTNTVEAALTGGVVDYVWVEPLAGHLLIFNSSDVFLFGGIALLVVSLLIDEWAWRRTQPRGPLS